MTHHLRYTNPNGTQKDWIATANSNGVEIRYGRTGSRLRTEVVPIAKCKDASAQTEALIRVNKKVNEGYFYVQGRPVNTVPDPAPPIAKAPSQTVKDWLAQDSSYGF